jgi:hypothetical protein
MRREEKTSPKRSMWCRLGDALADKTVDALRASPTGRRKTDTQIVRARVFAPPRELENDRFCPRVRLRLEVSPTARHIFFLLFSIFHLNIDTNITQTNT